MQNRAMVRVIDEQEEIREARRRTRDCAGEAGLSAPRHFKAQRAFGPRSAITLPFFGDPPGSGLIKAVFQQRL
jgi:hypothetical protein